ncbi:hypothetical protein [Synechococcus sp. CBW1107]|uniref:hypothetical protein n=1 Tax=Synechococcus sp. CBW1107 TaxID=2789857 RepID=UPI002AD1F98E|nr:hypothetical protein [Synechococcus sp. CBW1107]
MFSTESKAAIPSLEDFPALQAARARRFTPRLKVIIARGRHSHHFATQADTNRTLAMQAKELTSQWSGFIVETREASVPSERQHVIPLCSRSDQGNQASAIALHKGMRPILWRTSVGQSAVTNQLEMESLVKRTSQIHKITYIHSDRFLGFTRFVEDFLEEKLLVEGVDAPAFWGTDPLPPGRLSSMRMKKDGRGTGITHQA